ncbi:hypothetical protein Pcinc_012174 [Petrolisthes cinctipes]|uniref:Uncharacterized protein n=1 Tax=Petrolisthes cinctipes TaxID=88211 RepID=A0AAE1FZW5_PETCI|nr:hypothetical protein Pcinc_012174 [Petrolisthes cinctipes]
MSSKGAHLGFVSGATLHARPHTGAHKNPYCHNSGDADGRLFYRLTLNFITAAPSVLLHALLRAARDQEKGAGRRGGIMNSMDREERSESDLLVGEVRKTCSHWEKREEEGKHIHWLGR